MDDSTGIRVGRPFGGVAVLVKRDIGSTCSVETKSKRFIGIRIGERTLVLSVYMPCFSNLISQEMVYRETMSDIRLFTELHSNMNLVLCGDLNYDLRKKDLSYPSQCWSEFAEEFGMYICEPGNGNCIEYTYKHNGMGTQSWLDFAIISRSASPRSVLEVLDSHCNFSDHNPISFTLCVVDMDIPTAENDQSEALHKLGKIRWSEEICSGYCQRLSEVVGDFVLPVEINSCDGVSCAGGHADLTMSTYEDLIATMVNLAEEEQHLAHKSPHTKNRVVKCSKGWWNPQLSALKLEARQSFARYMENHNNVLVRDEMETARKDYRKEVRRSKRKDMDRKRRMLTLKWDSSDRQSFWKDWKRLAKVPSSKSMKASALPAFREMCEAVYQPNDKANAQHVKQQFERDKLNYHPAPDNKVIMPSTVHKAIQKLKKNKSSGQDGVSAEHLFYAPTLICDALSSLFDSMLRHNIVPNGFKEGIIVPVPKGKPVDDKNAACYRGICLNSVMLKTFEHILLDLYKPFFETSSNQYAFKTGKSTTTAISDLKICIDKYNREGSTIYCAFLDASKAFDKVIQEGVLSVLVKRRAPRLLLSIITSLIQGCKYKVRGQEGDVAAETGVKQGSVLSPHLFNMYMDELVLHMKAGSYGCYMAQRYMGVLLYADDIVLLSPSPHGLKHMLETFSRFARYRDIKINVLKSCCVRFGPDTEEFPTFIHNSSPLPHLQVVKYLGIDMREGGALSFKVEEKLRSVYKAANALFYQSEKAGLRDAPKVLFFLYITYCVPILRYGYSIIEDSISRRDRARLRVAHNSAVRKIFKWSRMDPIPEEYAFSAII